MTDQNDQSLFSDDNDATGVTTPPTTPPDPTGDGGTKTLRETLVGEGKKFKTDEDLARGKLEADNHILRLEAEAKEMREELNRRLAAEEILKQIEERHKAALESGSRETPSSDERPNNPGVSKDEIEKFVQSQLQERETLNTHKSNLATVKDQLVRKYGADYKTKVREKLNQLSLGEDFANGLAATQPKAFLELVGVNSTSPNQEGSLPKNTVRLGGDTNNNRDYAFYQKFRRENPSEYFSTKVQMQMHKDASEQGDAFYS